MTVSGKKPFEKRLSTFGKVVISYLVLGTVLLTASLFVTMNLAEQIIREKIEDLLMSTAQSIAGSGWVVEMLSQKQADPAFSDYLDDVIRQSPDISLITIADDTSMRFYHYNKDRVGEYFVGGDEGPALRGESFFSDAVGTMGFQRRAFAPVYGAGEKPIGFVMVSTMMTQLESMKQDVVAAYLRVILTLAPVTLLVGFILSASIREELMGFEPDKLVRSFVTREDVLNTLDEGILSVEESGEILFANRAAMKILGAGDEIQGQNLKPYFNGGNKDILQPGQPVYNREVLVKGSPVLYSRLPPQTKKQGYIILLRNKSEVTRLAEELTGTKHMVSALRANTHEFMNMLHVIWGLINMGQVEEACSYISHISELQEESIAPIMQAIHNPTVAGLLLGKISHMRETEIYFVLNRLSRLPQRSRYLSTQQLVTVVGNLVENAIDAVNECQSPAKRQIELQITEDDSGITIWIDDTGVGMNPGEEEKIFEQGYSTKGHGKGVGMALIKDIVDICGGTIEVESEKGTGTSVTIVINRTRKGVTI